MIGYWVTWAAEVEVSPGYDVGTCLDHVLSTLRAHREVEAATHQHSSAGTAANVNFHVRTWFAVTPDFAMVRSDIALRKSLRAVGHLFVHIRLRRWPEVIQRD